MSAITSVSGRGIPLRGNDIDTDRIMPARFLRCVTFDGLGEHAFEDDRSQLKAAGEIHSFDDAAYAGANILIVNNNFGCGSSREHAPQGLKRWGIDAIVGVSFAEIFFGNCIALGVPCLRVDVAVADKLQALVEANPQQEITVDVAAATVSFGDETFQAVLEDGPRGMFTEGQWDATGQLISGLESVKATAAQLPYMSNFA